MADILLIHGCGRGAWCRSGLIPKLRSLGHGRGASNLPPRGDDLISTVSCAAPDLAEVIRHLIRDNHARISL